MSQACDAPAVARTSQIRGTSHLPSAHERAVIAVLDSIRARVLGQKPDDVRLAGLLSDMALRRASERSVFGGGYDWGDAGSPTRVILQKTLPSAIFPCMNHLSARRPLDWIIAMRSEIRAMGRLLGGAIGIDEELRFAEWGVTKQRWELVDRYFEPSEEHSEVLRHLRYYGVAGDVLDVLLDLLLQRRSRHSRQKDVFDRCRLCWRYGRPYRKGYYYCTVHRPVSGNEQYKEHLRLLRWCRKRLELPFFSCVKSALARRYRARYRREPSDTEMTELLSGRAVSLSRFPHRTIGLPQCLARLPYVLRELNRLKVPLHSARAILRALDPIDDASEGRCRTHRLLHIACARDQHHLWAMLTWAEAWFAAASRRRSHWGGVRSRL